MHPLNVMCGMIYSGELNDMPKDIKMLSHTVKQKVEEANKNNDALMREIKMLSHKNSLGWITKGTLEFQGRTIQSVLEKISYYVFSIRWIVRISLDDEEIVNKMFTDMDEADSYRLAETDRIYYNNKKNLNS
jgi:hypothetical protein